MGSGALLRFRTTSKAEQILLATTSVAEKSAAITTAGVVTFAGTAPIDYDAEFAVGHVLVIGGNDYVVNRITSGTQVTVDPSPAGAVVASAFSIKLPEHSPGIAAVRSRT